MAAMLRTLLFATLLLGSPAQAEDWDDYWNSAGNLWAEAEYADNEDPWGEWIVTGFQVWEFGGLWLDLLVSHLAFPCASPSGDPVDWVIWILDDLGPPPGPPSSAHFSGTFTPPLIDGSEPPLTYATFELDTWIPVFGYEYVIFGYRNPGLVGLTDSNGIESWGWIGGEWVANSSLGKTAVLQLMGWPAIIPAGESSWGRIKSLY